MKHIKHFLLITLLLICAPANLLAQSSMTDSQIIEFVQKETAKGTDRARIVTQLVEKGVSVDRIRELQKKYEKQKNGSVVGAKDITPASRLRKPNSQEREEKENPNFANRKPKQPNTSGLTPHQRTNLKNEQVYDLDEEMDFLFPDSLQYYAYEEEPVVVEKKVFGRDIFRNKNLTFEPEMNIATPADYRLGPGDAVFIDIYGATALQYESTVSPEGYIVIDDYGPVNVNGLTVAQANARLASTVGTRYGGSKVKLSVGQTHAITVNVMGEVQMPGTYTLSAFATVFHALYMAGGTNEIGTMRDIKVYRNGRCVATIDLYDYFLNGNLRGNVRLASDDVIIVGPYDCLVNITGKVKRPMWYEMKSTESLGTLLKYSGGFTGDAYTDNVTLVRKNGGVVSVFSLGEFERDAFQLCDADSVNVDSTLNRYVNTIEIKGAVLRPGLYQLDANIATVSQLIEHAGGLTEDALTTRGIMHRRKADRSLQVKSFNTAGILDHAIADITLANEDVIYIPSLADQQAERQLVIEGEVMYPGIYDYAEGMTVEDLILQAGGMKDQASYAKVDVMRRNRDNQATESPETVGQFFTFSIKENFIVDGNEGFVLEPFDEVFVRQSPGNIEQQHVTVKGEAVFVGTYSLTKKNARLSDIIKLCGGTTSEAYLKGARLQRVMTEEDKMIQHDLIKMASVADSIDIDKMEIADKKFVGINLDLALENPGDDRYDIVLQDGDVLVIPQYNNTVTVNGEVMYPNTVAYQQDRGLKYYVNQSGGFSPKAKKSRVYAINMNGTVTRVQSAKDIQPGCNIIVPAKAVRQRMTTAQILSLTMSMASMGAVILNALR